MRTGNKGGTSKIQCNRDYNPKKKTVLAFAVGLHLSEDETIDLRESAGYAFGFENALTLLWLKVLLAFSGMRATME